MNNVLHFVWAVQSFTSGAAQSHLLILQPPKTSLSARAMQVERFREIKEGESHVEHDNFLDKLLF